MLAEILKTRKSKKLELQEQITGLQSEIKRLESNKSFLDLKVKSLKQWVSKAEIIKEEKKEELVCKLSTAIKSDYEIWLKGYFKLGKIHTHSYNYPFSRWSGWYKATTDINLPALYGSEGLHIIVKKGVKIKYKDLGHNELFYMDGYKQEGGIVPMFSDISSAVFF